MSNKLDNTIGIQWDEYGNPIIIDDEQAMIDYNAMEEEWEMDNYNEMHVMVTNSNYTDIKRY